MGNHKKKSKKHKKNKRKHSHKKRHSSSSNSSSSSSGSEGEWVEKESNTKGTDQKTNDPVPVQRDDWMNITSLPGLYSHRESRDCKKEIKQKEKEASQYNPKTSVRELNPYWKGGGDGLPSTTKTIFMKPIDNSSDHIKSSTKSSTSNWRKKTSHNTGSSYNDKKHLPSSTASNIYKSEEIYASTEEFETSTKEKNISSDYLTDKEMNEIAAKIVKAEILGNKERVNELKEKLEKARAVRSSNITLEQNESQVLLTCTDKKGFSKPLTEPKSDYIDNKRKKQSVDTHNQRKRQRYYPDDGKYTLKNMFESEKFGTSDQQDEEFMKAASKLSKSDDLDDLFMDNIRRKESAQKTSQKEKERAIREHQKVSQSLDNCQRCIQSTSMLKHLMVSLGETVFLSLPQYEPLTDGHCLIIPIRHVPCSTQLDENEWLEILEFRKSLESMFKVEHKSVVFYETAMNFHHYPHMCIHCVALPEVEGDMAPIYFKKAIDECEMEWSTNKKLINMTGKDVRKCVPKGLPYFWASFTSSAGFAHVIEEQKYFPKFFAEEIIGGLLDLHHSKWRKSNAQNFETQKLRVMEFSKNWTKFDCTNKQ